MVKARIGVVVGLLAVAATVIVFLMWPLSGGVEHRARQWAEELACGVSQHGLGVRPCASITEFQEIGAQTWRVRIDGFHGCFLVRADRGPTKRACKLGATANEPHARTPHGGTA
jgi:hypothetical protein